MNRAVVKRAVWAVGFALLGVCLAFLDFYLPAKDVVRIVGTDVKRMDPGTEASPAGDGQGGQTRDVRFINATDPDDDPRVYRNEETGWGFPWYLKFDSGNLQTEAQDLRSNRENPVWVVVTHYGWRVEIFSMFPNAVSIERSDGPDDFPVPWFRIVFFVLLLSGMVVLWVAWRRFKLRRRRLPDSESVAGR